MQSSALILLVATMVVVVTMRPSSPRTRSNFQVMHQQLTSNQYKRMPKNPILRNVIEEKDQYEDFVKQLREPFERREETDSRCMNLFSNQIRFATGYGPISVAVGDFNNDKQPDIAVANSGSDDIGVFFGNDNGTFTSQTQYATGVNSRPWSIAVGDFNNDNQLDIVVASSGTNSIDVLLGNGDGTLGNVRRYSTGSNSFPSSVAIGDFNNDNQLDIVVANFGDDTIGVFLSNGDGTFASQTQYATGVNSRPWSIAVGDFNNDNHLDIVVTNSGKSNIAVLLNNGNGTLGNIMKYSTGSNSFLSSVAIGDFNNDNQLDIVVANFGDDTIDVFLSNGDGTFASQTQYATGADSRPWSIAVGDFNNDNQLDIVVASSGSNAVSVFLGHGDGSFAKQKTFSTGYGPSSVAVGNFNNDDRLDIAVTNNNDNTMTILLNAC